MLYYQFKKTHRFFFAIILILVFAGCSKNTSTPPTPEKPGTGTNPDAGLQISSLSVNTGAYNTSVTIKGKGFSTTLADNQVFFNGKPAKIQNSTSTQILVLVPLSAGTGAIKLTVNGESVTGPVFTYQAVKVVTTFAGGGSTNTSSFIDGIGTNASFSQPEAIAIDDNDNLYVADTYNNAVRKITPDGVVTTLAGNGTQGLVDGVGAEAKFSYLKGITVDHAGNVYVTDGSSNIRKITPSGVVSTIIKESEHKITGGIGLAVDQANNLYIADQGAGNIKVLSNAGVLSTILPPNNNNIPFQSIALNKAGDIFINIIGDGQIFKVTSNGQWNPIITKLGFSWGFTIDRDDNFFVTDSQLGKITMISKSGFVSVIAGADGGGHGYYDGPVETATIGGPIAITVNKAGEIFFLDQSKVRKISVQ